MRRIKRSKFKPGPPGQRVLSKPKPSRRRSTKSDPPRTGLWMPGGDSSTNPLRSMRQRYAGSGKQLIVERRLERDEDTGELRKVYAPVEVRQCPGPVEVRIADEE